MFTVEATGTGILSYHWQWKPAGEKAEWEPCDADWCDGATLTIPTVQKSNEGSCRCVISNYAGTLTSNPAQLSVGKNLHTTIGYEACVTSCVYFCMHVADPPNITNHPQDLMDAIRGNFAKFAIQATGTEPRVTTGNGSQPRRRVKSGSHVTQSGVMVLH